MLDKTLVLSEGKVSLPSDLQDLYNQYLQEIHANTFNPDNSVHSYDSLPPIKEYVLLLGVHLFIAWKDEGTALGDSNCCFLFTIV